MRRRSFLEHLLVTTLYGAVAFAERDDASVRVGEELHLDVPWSLEIALAVEGSVAERTLCLALRGREGVVQLAGIAHDAHAAATAARRRLDDQREADLLGRTLGKRRDAGFARYPPGRELVSTQSQRIRRWPDPRQPGCVDRLCERGALGEKAVARMDRVGARLLRRTDVLLGIEVMGDLDQLIRRAGVQRAHVVGRRDRHGGDVELAAGAEDADGDLAAIRDEQLLDRHGRSLRTPDAPPGRRVNFRSSI